MISEILWTMYYDAPWWPSEQVYGMMTTRASLWNQELNSQCGAYIITMGVMDIAINWLIAHILLIQSRTWFSMKQILLYQKAHNFSKFSIWVLCIRPVSLVMIFDLKISLSLEFEVAYPRCLHGAFVDYVWEVI